MEPAEHRRFDRRTFIMGAAAAATGLTVVGAPLAFADDGRPRPEGRASGRTCRSTPT